jgi:hypothetical protein
MTQFGSKRGTNERCKMSGLKEFEWVTRPAPGEARTEAGRNTRNFYGGKRLCASIENREVIEG